MHARTRKLLEITGSSEQELRELWHTHGYHDAAQTAEILASHKCTNLHQRELMSLLIHASFPTDIRTGYAVSDFADYTKHLAEDYAGSTNRPALFSELDVSNMHNLCAAFDRDVGNKVARVMVETYVENLRNKGAKNIHITQMGSDAFRVLCTGIDDIHVFDEVREQTWQTVMEINRTLGTGRLRHSKHPDNANRAGVGIGIGAAFLRGSSASSVYDIIDAEVELDKIRHGKIMAANRSLDGLPETTRDLKASDHGKHISDSLKQHYGKELAFTTQHKPLQDHFSIRDDLTQTYEDARADYIAKLTGNEPQPFQQLAARILHDFHHTPDRITGFRSTRDLVEEIEAMSRGGQETRLFNIGTKGRTGLMYLVGHNLTNLVDKRIAHMVREELVNELGQDAMKFCYSDGKSGAFKVITRNPDGFMRAMDSAAQRVQSLNNERVGDFFEHLGVRVPSSVPSSLKFKDIQNPRNKSDKGLGFIYVHGIVIDNARSGKENLEALAVAASGNKSFTLGTQRQ